MMLKTANNNWLGPALLSLLFFIALHSASAQPNIGQQFAWSPSGSPNGLPDTNYWSQLDQLVVSQAELGGGTHLDETYLQTNGASVELDYQLGIVSGTESGTLGSLGVYSTNPIASDIYIFCDASMSFSSASSIDNEDYSVLTNLQNDVGLLFYGFLRRTGDGSPNPLSGVPEIWTFSTPTGPYDVPAPEPFDGYASPFGSWAIVAPGGAGPPPSNYWVFTFTNVPPGHYVFYAYNSPPYVPDVSGGAGYTLTNVDSLGFTFDPQIGTTEISDYCAIKSPATNASLPVGDPVPIHIRVSTGGNFVPKNLKAYNLLINGKSIFSQLFDWSTTTNLVDTNIIWLPEKTGANMIELNSVDTENGTGTASLTVTVTGSTGTVTSLPAIAIASPAGGGVTSTGVSGSATDAKGQISSVFYWLTNFNGGTNVSSGQAVLSSPNGASTQWAVTNIPPGTNIIAVSAVNAAAGSSEIVSRRFFFETPAALGLTEAGAGTGNFTLKSSKTGQTVSASSLNIGQGYEVAAVPASDSLFAGWTFVTPAGTTASDQKIASFLMESNLSIIATFDSNIFLGASGSYNGLFMVSNSVSAVTEETAGILGSLVIRTNGIYSGKLWLQGVACPVAGVFDASGNTAEKIAHGRSPVWLNMALVVSNNPPVITGSVLGSNGTVSWSASLMAERAGALPSAEYTMLIPPDYSNTPPNLSPGGFGRLVISNEAALSLNVASSKVKIAGNLADGTSFSQATSVAETGDVPLYARPYGNDGLLLGWINLNAPNAGGNGLAWIHPARKGLYAAGFTNVVTSNLMLSPWSNSIAAISGLTNLILAGTADESNAALATNIELTISNNFKLGGAPDSTPVSGAINPNTGVFTVTIGTGHEKTKGSGVILQSPLQGGGYFLTSTSAQAINIEP
jgi:hypothetical protein